MAQTGEYKKIFMQEAAELLQQMNSALLSLEKNGEDKEALNSIFRAAHTIKSMAASMGYKPISELAHKMEDLLERIRTGKTSSNEELVELLFKSFDLIESMVASVGKDEAIFENIEPVVAEICRIMGEPVSIPEEKTPEGFSLNVFEKRLLAKAKKDGYHVFHVKIVLDANCVLKSVRAFMVFRELHAIGEVVKAFPDSRLIEEEKFDLEFGCVFVTFEDKNAVKKKALEVLEISGVSVDEIEIGEGWDAPVASLDSEADKDRFSAQSEHIKKLQSIRVDIKRLDRLMNLVEELAITKLRLNKLTEKNSDANLKGTIASFGRLIDELQSEVMQVRLVPVGQTFDRFPRLVRDLAKKTSKKVSLEISGSDIELDRLVLDEIGDPLIHILRNAVDHGIEKPDDRRAAGKKEEGLIRLDARREKSHVFISVSDDGRGMDVKSIERCAIEKGLISKDAASQMKPDDILMLTTKPGFSTAGEVTDVSGRGVGLDVAKQKVESLGGSLVFETNVGTGTKITLRLPLTTAVIQALMVVHFGRTFALPIASVVEIVPVPVQEIKKIEGSETILHRDHVLPIVRLEKLFGEEVKNAAARLNVVVVEFNEKKFGIAVERLLNQQDIVIKQLTKELKGIRGFAGATILGDGNVALVLDVATLV